MTLTNRLPRLVLPAALGCALAAGAILKAQGPPESAPASLASVVAELRQLRAAIEDSNRRQSYIQMLSVHLSAQQSRLVETAKRLETTRRELSEAVTRAQEGQRVAKMFEAGPANPMQSASPAEAAGLTEMFKAQNDAAKAREDELRARESAIRQAFQIEEARWTDLIARLEQSVQQ